MDADRGREPRTNPTTVEQTSEREFVISRTFNGPARLVFEAWTTPARPHRWWVPTSGGITMVQAELLVALGEGGA